MSSPSSFSPSEPRSAGAAMQLALALFEDTTASFALHSPSAAARLHPYGSVDTRASAADMAAHFRSVRATLEQLRTRAASPTDAAHVARFVHVTRNKAQAHDTAAELRRSLEAAHRLAQRHEQRERARRAGHERQCALFERLYALARRAGMDGSDVFEQQFMAWQGDFLVIVHVHADGAVERVECSLPSLAGGDITPVASDELCALLRASRWAAFERQLQQRAALQQLSKSLDVRAAMGAARAALLTQADVVRVRTSELDTQLLFDLYASPMWQLCASLASAGNAAEELARAEAADAAAGASVVCEVALRDSVAAPLVLQFAPPLVTTPAALACMLAHSGVGALPPPSSSSSSSLYAYANGNGNCACDASVQALLRCAALARAQPVAVTAAAAVEVVVPPAANAAASSLLRHRYVDTATPAPALLVSRLPCARAECIVATLPLLRQQALWNELFRSCFACAYLPHTQDASSSSSSSPSAAAALTVEVRGEPPRTLQLLLVHPHTHAHVGVHVVVDEHAVLTVSTHSAHAIAAGADAILTSVLRESHSIPLMVRALLSSRLCVCE